MENKVIVLALVGVLLLVGIAIVGVPILAASLFLPAYSTNGTAPIVVVDTASSVPVMVIGITSVSPLNLASNQGLDNNIVVTFNETMNSSTVNSNTFLVKGPNNVKLSGVITSDATKKVWTFNPTDSLKSSSGYTINVTTGAKSASGKSLVRNYLSIFGTMNVTSNVPNPNPSPSPSPSSNPSPSPSPGPSPAPSPAPNVTVISTSGPAAVNLGSASSFVILSKSGVSTTGTTSIVGDIGASPIDSTAITGFGLIVDSSNTFSTSSLVTGKIYAADYTPPTPTKMTTAVSDMETAYTDAAGRTNPTATELGAGDISVMTITPGLYKWGTGVTINTGVTLNCQNNPNGVYIFQIAQDLTVGNGAIVTLSGGCQAKNIFWQVGGQATLGTTANFKGNILSQTLIRINTGATLNGRALAQTAVTLNANAVTISS